MLYMEEQAVAMYETGKVPHSVKESLLLVFCVLLAGLQAVPADGGDELGLLLQQGAECSLALGTRGASVDAT